MADENENKDLALANQYTSSIDANVAAFLRVKELAEFICQSDSFTKGFEQKDKSGNVIIDETTGKAKINTADVTIALMVGNRMGLSLAESVVLGTKLNQSTYLAVLKGRELGFGIATSMEKIYSIPTKNGLISYTGVDIISAKLLQGGIHFLPLIKQNAPYYEYSEMTGEKNELDLDQILDANDDLKPEYFLYEAGVSAETLKAKKDAGKIIITRKRRGYYSKVIMTRQFPDGRVLTISKRFSTVDAEKAGLYPMWDDKGVLIQNGKDNWIKATAQMLDNRVITIAGRIIGADLIQGLYSEEEAREIVDTTATETK